MCFKLPSANHVWVVIYISYHWNGSNTPTYLPVEFALAFAYYTNCHASLFKIKLDSYIEIPMTNNSRLIVFWPSYSILLANALFCILIVISFYCQVGVFIFNQISSFSFFSFFCRHPPLMAEEKVLVFFVKNTLWIFTYWQSWKQYPWK